MNRRDHLPQRRPSETIEFRLNGHRFLAGCGYFLSEDGSARLGEVFLTSGKSGGELDIFLHDAAIAVSFALQYGAPSDALARAFMRDAEGRPAGPLGMLFDIVLEASNAV